MRIEKELNAIIWDSLNKYTAGHNPFDSLTMSCGPLHLSPVSLLIVLHDVVNPFADVAVFSFFSLF